LQWTLEEALTYFEDIDKINYVNSVDIGGGERYRDQRRGSSGIRWKNMVDYVYDGSITFYEDPFLSVINVGVDEIWQRYVIHNAKTPNWIYRIAARGGNCAWYPDLSIIDFLS
jgi:hypothetical protein